MIYIFASLIILFTGATMASAQNPTCASRQNMVKMLKGKYQEIVVSVGLQNLGNQPQFLIEMWANQKTGTFSVLITNAKRMSCLVVFGTDYFQIIPPEPPIEGDPT